MKVNETTPVLFCEDCGEVWDDKQYAGTEQEEEICPCCFGKNVTPGFKRVVVETEKRLEDIPPADREYSSACRRPLW